MRFAALIQQTDNATELTLDMHLVGEEDEVLSISDLGNEEDEDSVYSRSPSPSRDRSLSSAGVSTVSHDGLPTLPRELQLRSRASHAIGSSSGSSPLLVNVCARQDVSAFTRFGPYQAKIRKDRSEAVFNWKVSRPFSRVKFPAERTSHSSPKSTVAAYQLLAFRKSIADAPPSMPQ